MHNAALTQHIVGGKSRNTPEKDSQQNKTRAQYVNYKLCQ